MKYKKIALFLLACMVIFAQPVFVVYMQREKFFSHNYTAKFETYKNAYYESQYTKKNPKNIITDDYFESFAGGAFLQGMNPIHIVHDHPPMGRYLIAGSIYFFNNQHIIILFCLFFSLLGLFLIGKMILPNSYIALIPVGIFANEPLFIIKLINSPLPEPIQLPFIIFSFYFFFKAIKKNELRWFIATSVMLGFVISTRFFVTGAAMIFSMFCTIVLFKRPYYKSLFFFITTLPISVCVLMLAYTRTMLDGYYPWQILSIQKYILAYHKSKFILPFSFWDLILFNKWHTWWGKWEISYDPNWLLIWPISLIMSFSLGIGSILKKFCPYKRVSGSSR
jgi:hypothetical protein